MEEIMPIAMPATHQKFMKYFKKRSHDLNLKILDIGAGHGALTKKLHELGYPVSACDLFPEIFMYDKIACRKVDISQGFPYQDNDFDIAIAVEVSEHIIDHEVFFRELSRILKPNGILYITTPNIVSMKSRMQFLFRGFFYSFKQLEMTNYNGLQHIASLTLDQYNYVAIKNGFKASEVDIDKKQRTSRWILFFLWPFLMLNAKLKNIPNTHNKLKLLLGRILFLRFENNKTKIPFE